MLTGTGRNASQERGRRDRSENTCESIQRSVDWSLLPIGHPGLASLARNARLKSEHLRELLSLALDEKREGASEQSGAPDLRGDGLDPLRE